MRYKVKEKKELNFFSFCEFVLINTKKTIAFSNLSLTVLEKWPCLNSESSNEEAIGGERIQTHGNHVRMLKCDTLTTHFLAHLMMAMSGGVWIRILRAYNEILLY